MASERQTVARRRYGLSRRRALGVTAAAAGGAFLAACGGNNSSSGNASSKASSNAAAPAASAASVPSAAPKTAATAAPQAPGAGSTPVGAATAASDTPVRGGMLRRGTWLSVLGIDPHIEVSVGLYMMASVYTYMAGFNAIENKLYPLFAQSFEQPSATEFVFKLRQGVKFHNVDPVNGREQTAADVVYSFQRFRDLPQAQNNDFFKVVTDKMEAVDAYTFRLTTKQPFAESINELGSIQKAIVPHEAVEKFGDLSQHAIGAGPFTLDAYTKGEKTVLKRNPDFYDKNLPYVDGVTWTTILDQATLLQAYKSDQIDIGAGPYEGVLLTKLDYDDLTKNTKLVNQKLPALHYGSLGLNATVKPFDDKRVRQALWLGVDRQQFIDKIGLGEGSPQGVLNNGLTYWALSQDELKPYIAPDVQKAKQLLAAAGYPNGFDMTIETSGGVQLYIDHAELLVAELKKLGINAKLNLTDLPSYLSDKLFKGNFNATVFTHNPYTSPKIPIGFYHKNGIGNGSWWHYDNEDISKAIDAENGEMDLDKRQKLVKDVQKAILEDGGPMINFFSPTLFQSYHKRVGGFDPALRPFQYFRYSEFLKPGA
jgi:peptide/nickel transport system substrate-binding protein